jgi:hypothetical protein
VNERASEREREREEEGDFKDYKRRGNWRLEYYFLQGRMFFIYFGEITKNKNKKSSSILNVVTFSLRLCLFSKNLFLKNYFLIFFMFVYY